MDDARFDAFTRAFTISRRTTGKTSSGPGSACSWRVAVATWPPTARRWAKAVIGTTTAARAQSAKGVIASARTASLTAAAGARTSTTTRTTAAGVTTPARGRPQHPTPTLAAPARAAICPRTRTIAAPVNAECPFGTYCDDGVGGILCRCFATDAPCDPGQGCCGGVCVDLQDNQDHCGSCNNPCTDPEICTNGSCV